MLPRKLTADQSETERARWQIVRTDTMRAMPGEIVAADVERGICKLRTLNRIETAEDGVTKTPVFDVIEHNLGTGGFVIVGR